MMIFGVGGPSAWYQGCVLDLGVQRLAHPGPQGLERVRYRQERNHLPHPPLEGVHSPLRGLDLISTCHMTSSWKDWVEQLLYQFRCPISPLTLPFLWYLRLKLAIFRHSDL